MRMLLVRCLAALAALLGGIAPHLALAAAQVVVDPVQVRFDASWFAGMNEDRRVEGRLRDEDARRIAAQMASSMQAALGTALQARGVEVVSQPGPSALRLSVSIDDLYINAPESRASRPTRAYVREAGRATLKAEARDTASGAVRLKAEERAIAGDTGRLSRATDVSNQFWFDALFHRWAEDIAERLARSP